uniref:Ig-like domain-containing protein n=1 Tax=Takifugu rubripes TaxID=31033 RepID=A0A674NW17_TAKRU
MVILFYILLFPVRFGGCTNNIIETKNVTVGETVRLKCPRKTSALLSWIRVIPGTLPELLGKSSHHTKDSHFTTKMESGSFDLVIKNPRVDDTGVYFCMTEKSAFLKRVDLTVVGEYLIQGKNDAEEEMCYSTPVFTRSKAQPDRGRLKDKETVYSEVRTPVTGN